MLVADLWIDRRDLQLHLSAFILAGVLSVVGSIHGVLVSSSLQAKEFLVSISSEMAGWRRPRANLGGYSRREGERS
jgi:hypothetical protein